MKRLLLLSLLFPSIAYGQDASPVEACNGVEYGLPGRQTPFEGLCRQYLQVQSNYSDVVTWYGKCADQEQQYQKAIEEDGGLVACPDEGPCKVVTCASQLKRRNTQILRMKRRIAFLEKKLAGRR